MADQLCFERLTLDPISHDDGLMERTATNTFDAASDSMPVQALSSPMPSTTLVFSGPPTPITRNASPTDASKAADSITPPIRPKSTPFPQPDPQDTMPQTVAPGLMPNANSKHRLSFHETVHQAEQEPATRVTFSNLPVEIHEAILDHLFGVRASTTHKSSPGDSSLLRGWATKLRHSRRKQLSELAVVDRTWRELVQSRIFRHIKIKATQDSIDDAKLFFQYHSHLGRHVKHSEFWFPRWELRQSVPTNNYQLHQFPVFSRNGPQYRDLEPGQAAQTLPSVFRCSSGNVTLSAVLLFAQTYLPGTMVMTLEGGNCKKSSMIKYFSMSNLPGQSFSSVDSVQTLVFKGAWNIMRNEHDCIDILTAFPNLVEFHASYNKCKGDAYLSIARSVPQFPTHIRHLNISLESEYTRELTTPKSWRKAAAENHFCLDLAKLCPQLESLTVCGRVCHQLFLTAAAAADPIHGNTRLKSFDITVKNCCRSGTLFTEGTGSTNLPFIKAFETLVIGGITSLKRLVAVNSLRIRFIDLQSTTPFVEPWFTLRGNEAMGLWSDATLTALAKVRPGAAYVELTEGFGGEYVDAEGRKVVGGRMPKGRMRSMNVASYEGIASEHVIN